MSSKFSWLLPGDVVASNDNCTLRRLEHRVDMDFSFLDVFFDFKRVGSKSGDGFVLANQGGSVGVTMVSEEGLWGSVSVAEGVGFIITHPDGAGSTGTGCFNLLGVDNGLAAGAKTIAFRVSSGVSFWIGYNAQILAPNSSTTGYLGVGASDNVYPFHAYARASGNNYFLASAVDTNYSVNGTHFAWRDGAKNLVEKNIIITCGSKENPSPIKIYIDGALAGIFDIAGSGQALGYMDLTSTDGIIRCFGAKPSSGSQNFAKCTVSYFAMARGEMSASEVAELNNALNKIA